MNGYTYTPRGADRERGADIYLENAKTPISVKNVSISDIAIEISAKNHEERYFFHQKRKKLSDFEIFGESPVFGDFGASSSLI